MRRLGERRPGFTFLDLAITALILGILASAAAPKFATSLRNFHLEAAARRIAADLQYARQQATTTGSTQSVVFSVATNGYSLPGLPDPDHGDQGFDVDLSGTTYPVTLTNVSFGSGGTDSTVVFDLYGRPDFGGSVEISLSGATKSVVVEAQSGKVSVQP